MSAGKGITHSEFNASLDSAADDLHPDLAVNENGEVVDEDLVGNVGDLPIEEEYIDDQGQVVSRAKDDSGNVYEQVFDDQGNLVEVRAA